jgi:alpha-1,2-mannosyltransferase
MQARRWAARLISWRDGPSMPTALVLVGVTALVLYVLPGLPGPAAHWPLWDVRVYWWGGQQATAGGGALYAPAAPLSFTYPPFAALLFAVFAGAPIGVLEGVLTVGSLVALVVLCGLSLGAAGVRRRPENVFAMSALALLTWPVAYTLHLGEVNLILAALIGADVLRRHDGGWWQGIGTGLAAGIKLTPLIFVAYLALTGRVRAAVTAAGVFAATVAAGYAWLPARSRAFWLGGVFVNQSRIGNPANPSDQSLAGAIARLAGTGHPPRTWWLVAVLVTGLVGMAVAVWAHRRGHRLAGTMCCAITGLLVSPVSWTHHWVWAVPLLVWLTAAAWRRRSVACGLAVAAGAAVFSGVLSIPWPGHPARPELMLASDQYVLYGLAVLAGTAVALAREARQQETLLPTVGVYRRCLRGNGATKDLRTEGLELPTRCSGQFAP